jgi:hypothetical protein
MERQHPCWHLFQCGTGVSPVLQERIKQARRLNHTLLIKNAGKGAGVPTLKFLNVKLTCPATFS